MLLAAFDGICTAAADMMTAPGSGLASLQPELASLESTLGQLRHQDVSVFPWARARMVVTSMQTSAVSPASQLAAALLEHWGQPEQQQQDALQLAQAGATRSCAYLRCANVGGEGGPAASQGAGSRRCGQCRAVWYSNTVCSHADWRQGGHRHVCKALREVRQQEKQQARAAQQPTAG